MYWTGGFLSNVGTWLQAVAGSVFVYDLTGSALAVGILNFVTFLPMLLFSVAGGVISDRFDRRAIAIVTHSVSLVIASALAMTAFAGVASELHVIVANFALQTSWTIAKPSLTAMLPALVSRAELTEAVGLNTLQFMTAQLAGPVLATVVLATSGAPLAFAINAATFLAPILAMLYLVRRGLGAGDRPTDAERGSPREGVVSYMRAQPWTVSLLVATVATSSVLEVIRTTAPVLVTQRLGAPSSDTGLIIAAQSVGYVLGILALIPLRRRGDLARPLAAIGLAFQAAGLLAVSASTVMAAAALGVAAIGVGFSLCFPVVTGTLQAEVPDAVRGRLMALHQMAHLGNRPFIALAAASLAAAFGVPVACVAATVLAPIGLVAIRAAWRRLDVTAVPLSAAAPSV